MEAASIWQIIAESPEMLNVVPVGHRDIFNQPDDLQGRDRGQVFPGSGKSSLDSSLTLRICRCICAP